MTARASQLLFEPQKSPDELRPGTKLLHGQYEILDYINSGGFGITYLAKDSLDREVVLKECFASAYCRRSETIVAVRSRAHAQEFNSIVKLFVQEAKNLAKLKHPNIVGVHQIFEDNDTAYMALDFVDGRDLQDLLDDPNDSLSPADVQSITMKLLDAIGYIHSTGVLHRDIAPDNVIVERRGNNPVLIDFGAAREDASRQARVLTGARVVKDGYSPQEFYIQGSEQTASSDLYALGATLYHLITGECPPDSQSRLAAVAAQRPDPFEGFKQPIPGYGKEFLQAIEKAMQIFPYERVQSAQEWIDMIRPGAEIVALPGGKVAPKRVVSRPISHTIRPVGEGDGEDIEVAKATPRTRTQQREQASIDFLNIRTPQRKKKSSPVVPVLGAVAACVVIGLGAVYMMPEIRDFVSGKGTANVTNDSAVTPVAPSGPTTGEAAGATSGAAEAPEAPAVVTEMPVLVLPEQEAPAQENAGPAASLEIVMPDVPAASAPVPATPAGGADAAVPEGQVRIIQNGVEVFVPVAPENRVVESVSDKVSEVFVPAAPEFRVIENVAPEPVVLAAPATPPLTSTSDLEMPGQVEPAAPTVSLNAPVEQQFETTIADMPANASVNPVLPTIDIVAPEPPAKPVVTPEPTVAAAPAVVAAPPAQPDQTGSEATEVSAVMAGWTVAVPFTSDPNDNMVIGRVEPGAPDWVKPGLRVLEVNGRDVSSIADIPDAVRRSATVSGKSDVLASIVVTETGTFNPRTEMLVLPAVRDVVLLNGTQFRTYFEDGAWKTVVVSSPETNPNGLRTGDQLIAYIPTSEKLTGETSLSDILERELRAGTSRFAFAVNRDGELWVASVSYKGTAN